MTSERPLVGIGGDLVREDGRSWTKLYATYYDGVRAAGGVPVILPPLTDPGEARELLRRLDGLVIPGGDDIPGSLVGEPDHPRVVPVPERRLRADRALVEEARASGVPTLGICYGMQLMNVALDGGIIQDIPDQVPGAIRHAAGDGPDPRHEVVLETSSRLADLLDAVRFPVNSRHHQAVGRPGEGIRAVGRASDGVVEAIEATEGPFFCGVQWHPEKMAASGDGPGGSPILGRLVEEARRGRADGTRGR